MKAIATLLALLVLFAFLAGCNQPGEDDKQPTPTPNGGEEVPALTEAQENQELNDFESTLINEDEEIEIGEII